MSLLMQLFRWDYTCEECTYKHSLNSQTLTTAVREVFHQVICYHYLQMMNFSFRLHYFNLLSLLGDAGNSEKTRLMQERG